MTSTTNQITKISVRISITVSSSLAIGVLLAAHGSDRDC